MEVVLQQQKLYRHASEMDALDAKELFWYVGCEHASRKSLCKK